MLLQFTLDRLNPHFSPTLQFPQNPRYLRFPLLLMKNHLFFLRINFFSIWRKGGGAMALLALLALEIWKIWVQSAKSAKSAKKFFNQNRVYLRKFRKNQFSKLAFIRSEILWENFPGYEYHFWHFWHFWHSKSEKSGCRVPKCQKCHRPPPQIFPAFKHRKLAEIF